nr:hypothetical protein [Shuttleworthia satelles]
MISYFPQKGAHIARFFSLFQVPFQISGTEKETAFAASFSDLAFI